jgi:hypothetical protein
MPVAQTRKEFYPLCYGHHQEMMPDQYNLHNTSDPRQTTAYACREPGCLVRYDSSRGYFIVQGGNEIEEEATPSVTCMHDGTSMLKCSRRTLVIACGDARNAMRAEPMRKASQSANPSEHFMEKPWRPGAAGIATDGISRWIFIRG